MIAQQAAERELSTSVSSRWGKKRAIHSPTVILARDLCQGMRQLPDNPQKHMKLIWNRP